MTGITYPGIMPSTKPFISFVADPEFIKRIDDWRFANRYPSRAAAIKALIEQSLNQSTNQA